MKWIVLILVIAGEEYSSTGYVLAKARLDGTNLYVVHLVWLCTEVFDTAIGYYFGNLLSHRILTKVSQRRVGRWLELLRHLISRFGEASAITILQLFVPAYVSGFLGACIQLPRKKVFIFTLIGEAISYSLIWSMVLGIGIFTHNWIVVLSVMFGIGILVKLISGRAFYKGN